MLEEINDYLIRKVVKINDTGVFVFFKDNDSAPLISFSELLTAVYGSYKHDVSLYAKQIKKEHRFLLLDRKIKRIVVDFEGAASFMRNKMNKKFADEEIARLSRNIDNLVHELPGPVKSVELKPQSRDYSAEQLMVYVKDNVPVRYLTEENTRWFNGNDLCQAYCGGSREIFDEALYNLREGDYATFAIDKDTIFVHEVALDIFLIAVDPDNAGDLFSQLMEAVKTLEDVLEDNDVSTAEVHEDLPVISPYERVDVPEQEKDNEEELEEHVVYSLDDTMGVHYVIKGNMRWLNGNDLCETFCKGDRELFNRAMESIDENSRTKFSVDESAEFISYPAFVKFITFVQKEEMSDDIMDDVRTYGDIVTHDTLHLHCDGEDIYVLYSDICNSNVFDVSDYGLMTRKLFVYNGEKEVLFVKLDEAITKYIQDEDEGRELWERVTNFMFPPKIRTEKLPSSGEPVQDFLPVLNKDNDEVGNVVAYVRLSLDRVVLCALYKKQEELYDSDAELFSAFKAEDIATLAGFTQGATLARKRVSENEFLRISIKELKARNITMVTYRGVLELVEDSVRGKEIVDALRKELDSWLNENRTSITFNLEKVKVKEDEEKRSEEIVQEQTETVEELTQEQATQAVKEALSDPERRAQIEEAMNQLPNNMGEAAANLLNSFANQEDVTDSENVYRGVVTVNDEDVRIIIVRSPKGGITPHYEVHDFCTAWKISIGEVLERIATGNYHPYKQDNSMYLIYSELADVISDSKEDGRVFVSKTMKASGEAFKNACQRFSINFKDDTQEEKTAPKSDTENINTDDPEAMKQLLSYTEDGHAYTLGAIMLAERLRAVLMWFKNSMWFVNSGEKIDIEHLPGPTNNNVVKDLWAYINTQDATQPPSHAMQRAVITAYERYMLLVKMAKKAKS